MADVIAPARAIRVKTSQGWVDLAAAGGGGALDLPHDARVGVPPVETVQGGVRGMGWVALTLTRSAHVRLAGGMSCFVWSSTLVKQFVQIDAEDWQSNHVCQQHFYAPTSALRQWAGSWEWVTPKLAAGYHGFNLIAHAEGQPFATDGNDWLTLAAYQLP